MASLGKKVAMAAVVGVVALTFAVFVFLFLRYDRGDDPNNEDEILSRAEQAEASDEPVLAVECWRRLVALNPFNDEYARRYFHACVRVRDFEAIASFTNNLPLKLELTESEKELERLISEGAAYAAAKSNELSVACFERATNLNYYAATPFLIDCEMRSGAVIDALDTARAYIKRFPRYSTVLYTAEWLALANRPDLIEETRQVAASAAGDYDGVVLVNYCDALAAWTKGDKAVLADAIAKIGPDAIKTPVARIMALESAADGDDAAKVLSAYHALAASPVMFDFPERGRSAVKRFVANHFPDKLPIRELGRISDLLLSKGDDLELLRVSLLAKLVDGSLREHNLSNAERLYPGDLGLKTIREEYERVKASKVVAPANAGRTGNAGYTGNAGGTGNAGEK